MYHWLSKLLFISTISYFILTYISCFIRFENLTLVEAFVFELLKKVLNADGIRIILSIIIVVSHSESDNKMLFIDSM